MHAIAQPQRRLDELVLEALASHQISPISSFRDDEVSIEVVYADDEYDIAVTDRFIRHSLPYERVELDLDPSPTPPRQRRRPTTFVRTIRARQTEPMALPPMPVLAVATLPIPAMPGETHSMP